MAIRTAAGTVSSEQGTPSSNNPKFLYMPMAAADAYQGSVMMLELNSGYVKVCPLAVAGTSAGINPVLGVLRGSCLKGSNRKDSDNCLNSGGSAGDRIAIIETGVHAIALDTTAGSIPTFEHIGRPVFMMDDQTVSANPLSYNRPQAGIFMGLSQAGLALVAMGPHIPNQACRFESALANADLSGNPYQAVVLVTDTGIAEYAQQATNTGMVSGILVNAGTATGVTKIAMACTYGPCPAVAGAAGFVVGTELMVTTSGALVAATTGKVVVGQALETATSGQTRMIRVAPRQLA